MNLKTFLLCLTLVACTDAKQDSSSSVKKTHSSTDSGIDLNQIRETFISSYYKPITIDTSFYWQDTLFKVKFIHFATMDSGIIVPAKYNFDTNKPFVTHNFESQLFIIKNSDTILTRNITKQTFKEYLTPELDSFATLLFPNCHIHGDTVELGYSLTIPVTDVGIHVDFKLNSQGTSHTFN